MRKLFDEYGTLLLCYVCSIIGFNMIYNLFLNGNYIHDIVGNLLYGMK